MNKRVFLTVVMVALGAVAMAQSTLVVRTYKEGRGIDQQMVQNGRYLTTVDSLDCWLTKSSKGARGMDDDDNWQVACIDAAMQVQKRFELLESEDCRILAAAADGSRAGILVVDSIHNKKTLIYKVSVDLQDTSKEHVVALKMDTAASFVYERKDRCIAWGAASPNGQYFGLVTVMHFTARKEYKARVEMFDSGMNLLWSKEYPVGTVDNICVTDNGQMLTLGADRSGEEVVFKLNVIDSRDGNSYEQRARCGRLKGMRIVAATSNSVIASGLFAASGTNPKEDLYGGVAVMTFDMVSRTFYDFLLRPFDNEDVNVMLNKKTKKVQRDLQVDHMDLLSCTPAPFGVVMAFGQRYMAGYVKANGTHSKTRFASGLHLVAVDEQGTVRWVRNVRRSDICDGDETLYFSLFSNDEDICLVKNEHRKTPTDYDIAKEVPQYEIGEKSNLVIYRIGDDGEVRKDILEKKTKHQLTASAKRPDGTVALLTLKGGKVRLMELMEGE